MLRRPCTGKDGPALTGRSALVIAEGLGRLLLTAAPRFLLRRLESDDLPLAVPAARLLGLRWLAQAAAAVVSGGPAPLRVSAVVAGVHAATMTALLADQRYRRIASISALVAVADAGANWTIAGRR